MPTWLMILTAAVAAAMVLQCLRTLGADGQWVATRRQILRQMDLMRDDGD